MDRGEGEIMYGHERKGKEIIRDSNRVTLLKASVSV